MENKKLFFEVDGSQIDFKSLLKKEFLELTMRPISTANPNRNNSWFTRESLVASKDTFKNKPILGYFENGDFVSHNGEWKADPETELEYWDTTGAKGERPIGLIRENDEVQIVDDPKTGLSWVVLTCALWTQYNYKQVKRLLKDAKKAKQNGGPVKNISVEVDITDWEELPNGVLKINAFNLVGITILGSRNGVKVEPGIADAELSVVGFMETDTYSKQLNSLRLAYEKLDGSEKTNKEDFSEMELENQENVATPTEDTLASTPAPEAGQPAEPEAPKETDEPKAEEAASSQEAHFEEENHDPEDSDPENKHENEEQHGTEDPDDEDEDEDDEDEDHEEDEKHENEEDVCPECGKNPCECEKHENEDNHFEQEEEPHDPIRDIAWLISDVSWNIESLQSCIEYYEAHEEIPGRDYILAVLRRFKAQAEANEKELAELMAKVAEGISEEEMAFAEQLCGHCDCKSEFAAYNELLYKYNAYSEDYEKVKKERDDLSAKFEAIEKEKAHEKFMADAKAIIDNANLSDEITVLFENDCKEGKITSLDELKTQIGLKLYELNSHNDNNATFEAPINTPITDAFINDKKAEKKGNWDRLKEYVGK